MVRLSTGTTPSPVTTPTPNGCSEAKRTALLPLFQVVRGVDALNDVLLDPRLGSELERRQRLGAIEDQLGLHGTDREAVVTIGAGVQVGAHRIRDHLQVAVGLEAH